MTVGALLDNFETLIEAPEGITRLRKLILELAVRGRLVAQDADDPSASGLANELAQLVSESPMLDPITADETPWQIPANWQWCRFKEVVDFRPGKTPPTKDSSYWADPGEGHPWATIADMPESGVLLTTARTITDRAANKVISTGPAPVGTLLMSYKLTIGKVCRTGISTYFNEAIIAIESPFEATLEYLFRTLPLLASGGQSKDAIKGKTLNKKSLTNIPIPLPPLREQEQIVERLDVLTELCDELETALERRANTADAFGQAVAYSITSEGT